MIATVIASWSGPNNAASANGIGVAPITAAAAAAAIIIFLASAFFNSKLFIWDAI